MQRESRAPMTPRSIRYAVAALLIGILPLRPTGAQELEPLAYAHNPVGANFLLAGYSVSYGDILFDTSAPLSDVSARWNSATLAYGRTFSLFGRSANFAVAAPVVWGKATGKLEGEFGEAERFGLADPRIRLGINLIGGPAITLEEFFTTKPRTTLGATLVAVPPAGEYMNDKLINLGANRWSLKTELGLSHPRGPWRFEAAAGVWWFGDNDDFLEGNLRTQDPITAFQLHAIYSFRPQAWVSASATWYRGGTTTFNDTSQLNFQSNTRFGITGSYPLGRRHSVPPVPRGRRGTACPRGGPV